MDIQSGNPRSYAMELDTLPSDPIQLTVTFADSRFSILIEGEGDVWVTESVNAELGTSTFAIRNLIEGYNELQLTVFDGNTGMSTMYDLYVVIGDPLLGTYLDSVIGTHYPVNDEDYTNALSIGRYHSLLLPEEVSEVGIQAFTINDQALEQVTYNGTPVERIQGNYFISLTGVTTAKVQYAVTDPAGVHEADNFIYVVKGVVPNEYVLLAESAGTHATLNGQELFLPVSVSATQVPLTLGSPSDVQLFDVNGNRVPLLPESTTYNLTIEPGQANVFYALVGNSSANSFYVIYKLTIGPLSA